MIIHALKTVAVLCYVEDKIPTMKDINRYVTRKHAADWKDIGIELDLSLATLNIIEKDHPLKSEECFIAMIDEWIQLTGNDATWKALEIALTNVNRQKLDLDPVDDVHGMTKVNKNVCQHCNNLKTHIASSIAAICGRVKTRSASMIRMTH